jgi:hypothetical protein
MKPSTGDLVKCDMCRKTYRYFIWAMGSDKCLCRGCVRKRPSAYLDGIDAIDIGKEQDIIDDEIGEQERRDGKLPPTTMKPDKPKKYDTDKIWRRLSAKTIAEFKERETCEQKRNSI